MKSYAKTARQLDPDHFDSISDEHHVVIPMRRNKVFFHSGDFGDIIYALPVIRALGGGKLVIGPTTRWKTRQALTEEHVDLLKPLLLLQPYITEIEFSPAAPLDADVDLNKFREYLLAEHATLRKGSRRLNLAEAHLYTFKLPLVECDKPWLTLGDVQAIRDHPVILHRSSRWRNEDFPWAKVMERHGHHAAFVGLEEEHAAFVADWGSIPYRKTHDFLELARIIAGSKLYIGNQSLPYAICEGLKHMSLLEVWPDGPNCIFDRNNAIYGSSAIAYIPEVKDTDMNTTLNECPLCATSSGQSTKFLADTNIVKCASCSLVYLRVHPDEEQTLLYYQQYADDHSHMRLPKNFDDIRTSGLRREKFMQNLLSHAKPEGSMLDIGCGWGAFLSNAREKGFTPFGIDVCHKAANFSASMLGIPTLCDKLENCAFPDDTFDVVVTIHTLEHLMNTSYAFKRIRALLKKGGIFCGVVPNIGSYCSLMLKERWQWLDENTHYVHFTTTTLNECLKKHGFKLLEMSTQTGDYDLNELRRVVAGNAEHLLETASSDAAIQELCASGMGEEIRFFAAAV